MAFCGQRLGPGIATVMHSPNNPQIYLSTNTHAGMDQKFVVAGNMLTAVLLFFCALMMLPVGIGLLFAYPDKMWWLGLGMLVSCGLLIYGGISNIRLSKRLGRQADVDMAAVAALQATQSQPTKDIRPTQPAASDDVAILARWTYTPEEWKAFMQWERKKRKTSSTVEAALILVVGGAFIYWAREADPGLSFGISAVVACIYWYGKNVLFLSSIGRASSKGNEVVITSHAAIINGSYNAFRSEVYWLKGATLDESPTPAVLEIVYQWQTRKGITHEEIRVPVPEGKCDEARAVIAAL